MTTGSMRGDYLQHWAGTDILLRTGANFSYTIELPDDGREFGFLLPASLAEEVGQDIWTSLTSLTLRTLARS